MTKPPERLRYVFDTADGFLCETDKPAYWYTDTSVEIFYTLEKPMEHKTENLTTEEAFAAISKGECVLMRNTVHAIRGDHLCYWNGRQWVATNSTRSGPYSIVPDPSKSEGVEGNFQWQIAAVDTMLKRGEYKNAVACILTYIDCLYVRKP